MDDETASHPSRGAWIEIVADLRDAYNRRSHPSRGAWIEMITVSDTCMPRAVAPLTGCVD